MFNASEASQSFAWGQVMVILPGPLLSSLESSPSCRSSLSGVSSRRHTLSCKTPGESGEIFSRRPSSEERLARAQAARFDGFGGSFPSGSLRTWRQSSRSPWRRAASSPAHAATPWGVPLLPHHWHRRASDPSLNFATRFRVVLPVPPSRRTMISVGVRQTDPNDPHPGARVTVVGQPKTRHGSGYMIFNRLHIYLLILQGILQ